jgi:hypothetical protein
LRDTTENNDRNTTQTSRPRLGFVASAIGSLLVLGAAVVFVWSGVTTASARIAATTSNDSSLINAAVIDLVVDGGQDVASTGLLIDAAGLYPGRVVERCFEVAYRGTPIGVPVRMFGLSGGGTGLEAYLETTVEAGAGSSNECDDFERQTTLFSDTLLELWNRHGSFESGLPLMEAASDGSTTWIRVSIEVADDNRAQDLTTTFWLTLEARP